MKKGNLYSLIILSFCTALLDFSTATEIQAVYPRDRICHIIISALTAMVFALMINRINFEIMIVKITAAALMLIRLLIVVKNFIQFFNIFHGANTMGIILSAMLTALMFGKYIYRKTHLLYGFFCLFNISLLIMIFALSFPNLNVANMYSNSMQFVLSSEKLFAFFEILTISVIVKDKGKSIFAQSRYIALSAAFMIVITLLQGMCVSGDLLYSISPLQSLTQVFYTDTVKRFDYVFSIYYVLDFLAAVMLYIWSLKTLFTSKEEYADEDI